MSPTLKPEDENLQRLERSLGYTFRDRTLLVSALTHRSFANESPAGGLTDNERLEFLGDAVLDLVVSEYLMATLPDQDEGTLTRIRADVVALPSLAEQARSLDVGRALLLGKGEEGSGGREKPSLLADALEALFGAVFSDGGYAAAKAVILPIFTPLMQQSAQVDGQDYKTRLQEALQATQRALPLYRLADTTGPAHERSYLVEVMLEGQVYGSGRGRTKKAAEQAAAKAALVRLDRQA